MFGPVDTTKTYTVVTVHTPCQVGCLRRAVLPRGVYQYQGDLRPKVRQLSERRKILAGLFSIEVFNAPTPTRIVVAQEKFTAVVAAPAAITPDTTVAARTAVGILTQKVNGRTKLRNLDPAVLYQLRGGYTLAVDHDQCRVRVERCREGAAAEQHAVTFVDRETMGAVSASQAVHMATGSETEDAPAEVETETPEASGEAEQAVDTDATPAPNEAPPEAEALDEQAEVDDLQQHADVASDPTPSPPVLDVAQPARQTFGLID
jgi:hypothetical protein